MADEISISITEDVTSVTVTEDVTTINITPSVTTVEAKGIALGTAGAATATAYQNSNTNLAVGATVAASLDHINTNGFNKNANNTVDGNTTIAYDHKINFTAGTAYDALNLANNNIIGVNKLHFADAGFSEGIDWENIRISETNDALTANAPGDLHIQFKQSDNTYARRFTVRDTGVDVVGTITFDGGTTSADLNFGDDVKALFGAGSDLQIFYDSSTGNSKIREQGSGNLIIEGKDVLIRNVLNGEAAAKFISDGTSQLHFDGSKKIETTADGVDITGDLAVTGNTNLSSLKVARDNGTAVITLHDSTDDDDHAIYLTGLVNGVGASTNIFSLGTNDATNQFQMHSWLDRDFEFTFGSNKHVDAVATISTSGLDVNGNFTVSGGLTVGGTTTTDTATATTFSGDLNGTINTATTATTQSQANNSTKVATTAYVDTAVAGLVDGAPDGLNTLHELATALEDDVAFSTTVTNNIGTKLAKASNLSDLTNAGTARTNLGLGTAATTASTDYATAAQGSKADTAHGWGNHADAGYGTSNLTIGSGAGQAMAGNTSLTTTLGGLTDVDATTGLANGKILKYNGTDSEWQVADDAGGIALTDISVSATEGTADGNGGIAYANTTGVFTYTPPDLSSYITSVPSITNLGGYDENNTTAFLRQDGTFATPAYIANTFRPVQVDTDGDNTNNNALESNEALVLKGGSNVTLAEEAGVVTISSVSDTNTFRPVQVDTDGDNTNNNALEGNETLILKKGTNITLAEDAGVVTINATNSPDLTQTGNTLHADNMPDDISVSSVSLDTGTNDWKASVNASNELEIHYGATKVFELDSSGNLKVKGDITAYTTF